VDYSLTPTHDHQNIKGSKMKDRYKIMTFDFLMEISLFEFLLNYISLSVRGYTTKSFQKKIGKFIDERHKNRISKT
tara:strand:- start:472 stop:699 length:228 start_codon:yes stop_codon:yes gene_type:complete